MYRHGQAISGGRRSSACGPEGQPARECACFEARDIGEYDTCPHGCVYCYAVRNRPLAQRRHAQHDPAGEFLFPPLNLSDNESGPDEPFQVVMFE
jgi:DNA repair photolyase